ncbi:MAG TPA: cation-transporting P-type ATPase, partial [Flavobacterium sp.]|nr:cation-transporting P-type ATPase [Flavobacterium sp.]
MEQNILTGLTDSQVLASQKKYGYNRMDPPQKSGALQLLL